MLTKIKLTLAVLVGLFMTGVVKGQSDKQPLQKSSINELSFECSFENCIYDLQGVFLNDIPTLKNDNGVLFSGFDINTSTGGAQSIGNPVAYVSGQTMEISLNFHSLCGFLPQVIGVRGKNIHGSAFHFPAKAATVTDNGNGTVSFTYQSRVSSQLNSLVEKSFSLEKVDFFTLDILWEISVESPQNWNQDSNWNGIGTTTNKVYVTWREPKAEAGNSYIHAETLFYLGCISAIGQSDQAQIISSVWNQKFKDANLSNVSSEPLHYYGNWGTDNVTTSKLLSEKDGQCDSWDKLFLDVNKTQGLEHQGQIAYISPNIPQIGPITDFNFLVNKWQFTPTPSMPLLSVIPDNPNNDNDLHDIIEEFYNNGFVYLNVFVGTINNTYKFTYSEATDENGLVGQNQNNPASDFFNHKIAKLNNTFYDAPYGVNYQMDDAAFIVNYENSNIAGYYIQTTLHNIDENNFIIGQAIDLNGDEDTDDEDISIKVWLIKKNEPTTNNFIINSFSDY